MKAAINPRFGPPSVVQIVDVPKPRVGEHDLLVKVHATTVTAGDWRLRSGDVPPGFGLVLRVGLGLIRPKHFILGTDFAGVIEAVGSKVTRFAVSNRVFGARFGAHAEYVRVREDQSIAAMPSNLSFTEAAPLPFGGITALYYLRDQARVQPGERVLINGASGGVGSAAVQLARHFGAHVTGVTSTANVELVKSLGAERVIDYKKEDFHESTEGWNVILDAVGNCSFARTARLLAPGGRLLLVVGSLGAGLGARLRPRRGDRRVLAGTAVSNAADVRLLGDLAQGGVYRAVIDRIYPFDRIVDAHTLVESGHKKGNVVLTVP